MEYKSLPESELEVMLVLWKAGRPMTRGEIEERLHAEGKKHWAPSTVLSLLYRLIDKEFVVSERPGRGKTAQFAAAVAEQEYLNYRVNLVTAQRNMTVAALNLLASIGKMTAASLNLNVAQYHPEDYYNDVSGKWIGTGI